MPASILSRAPGAKPTDSGVAVGSGASVATAAGRWAMQRRRRDAHRQQQEETEPNAAVHEQDQRETKTALHLISTISIAMRSGPSIIAARELPHGWISSRNFTPSRLQSRDRLIEIGRADRPVIDDLAARADQAAARPRTDRDRDVVDQHAAGRIAHEAGLRKRRPRRRRVGLGLAVLERRRRRRRALARRHLRAEVRDVPVHRAVRMLVIHVHVIEALGRPRLRVLDHRAVGPAQVAEAAFARRLRALRAHLEDLFLRRQSRQRVARHVHELAVGGVPHLRDRQSHRAELLVVLA